MQTLLELDQEENLIYYNKSPLRNGKNFKTNCDIDEMPEGRFPLII